MFTPSDGNPDELVTVQITNKHDMDTDKCNVADGASLFDLITMQMQDNQQTNYQRPALSAPVTTHMIPVSTKRYDTYQLSPIQQVSIQQGPHLNNILEYLHKPPPDELKPVATKELYCHQPGKPTLLIPYSNLASSTRFIAAGLQFLKRNPRATHMVLGPAASLHTAFELVVFQAQQHNPMKSLFIQPQRLQYSKWRHNLRISLVLDGQRYDTN